MTNKAAACRVSPPIAKNQDIILTISPVLYSLATGPLMAPALLKAYLAQQGLRAHCLDLNLELWHFLDRDTSLFSLEPHPMIAEEAYEEFKYRFHLDDFVSYWAQSLTAASARWVGFSIHDKRTEKITKELCRKIKSLKPTQKIVIGGSQVQYCGSPMFKEGIVDEYMVGEGEEALLSLLKGGDPVCGLTLSRFGEANLAKMPISDFSDFPLPQYPTPPADPTENIMVSKLSGDSLGLKYLFVQGSRSCIWHCDFCHVRVTKGSFRQRPAADLACELFSQYERHGIKNFVFADNLLNANLKHLEEFCQNLKKLYQKHRIQPFSWEGFFIVRGENQLPENYFAQLQEAGCHRLHFGVESGSPDVRKHMGKRFSNEDLIYSLQQLGKYGLTCRLMFFVGHPFETDQNFKETIDLMGQLLPYKAAISHLNIGHTASVLRNSRLKNTLLNQDVFIDKDPRFDSAEFYNEFKLWRYEDNVIELRLARHSQLRHRVLELGFNLEDPLQDKMGLIEKLIRDYRSDGAAHGRLQVKNKNFGFGFKAGSPNSFIIHLSS